MSATVSSVIETKNEDEMVERPAYLEQILPFVGKGIIKILVGVRRSGKSTLLGQIRDHLMANGVPESSIITMNLESAQFSHIADAKTLQSYVYEHCAKSGKTYAFFDEIQEVDGWEKALRSFMIDYDIDMYVTGSNAHLLSGELATHITGRYVQIPVYPFSFEEYVRAVKKEKGGIDIRDAFADYLDLGGFPFQYDLGFQHGPSLKYLTDIYGTILLKDVVQREDAIGKRLLRFNEKYYAVDQGLRRARGFSNASAIDQILENIVFIELLRRGYQVSVGKVGDREIDFIAERSGEREYYQVAYLLAEKSTVDREFSVLEAVPDNYPKYVLSLNDFQPSRNGIQGINLIDWLLDI